MRRAMLWIRDVIGMGQSVVLAVGLVQLGATAPVAARQGTAAQDGTTTSTDLVTLTNSAVESHQRGNDAEAIEMAERAERSGDAGLFPRTPEGAAAWNHLGRLLAELGYNQRAKSAYGRALELAEDDPDILTSIGQIEQRLGALGAARDHLEAAVSRLQQQPDVPPLRLARAIDNLALLYTVSMEFDKAAPLHQKALEVFERESGPFNAEAATTSANLGLMYRLEHDYPRAEAYSLRAFDAHDQLFGLEHDATLADAANLAALYLDTHNQVRMEQLVNALVAIGGATPGKQHMNVANRLHLLAESAEIVGQLALAERLAARAVEIFTAAAGPRDQATLDARELLASLQSARLDFTSADKNYRWLEQTYTAAGRHLDSAKMTIRLATVYRQRRAYQVAAELLENAIERLRAESPDERETIASALGNLAEVFRDADSPSKAEDAFGRALAVIADQPGRADLPWLLHGQALLYYHLGKYEQAQRGFERAREIWSTTYSPDHPFVATTLGNLALVAWGRDDSAAALEAFTQASTIKLREFRRTLIVGAEQQRLANAKELSADLSRVLSFCFAAAACDGPAGRLSATLLLEGKGRVLDAMADTVRHISQDLAPNDRGLVARLEQLRREIAKSVSPTLLSGESPVSTPALEKLLSEEAQLETTLSYKSAAYRASLEPVTLAGVQHALPAGATLVEYVRYSVFESHRSGSGTPWREDRYAALVLREGDWRWFNLGPAADVERAVEQLRGRLRNRATYASEARRLSLLILAPIQNALPKRTRTTHPLLLIAPDGSLNLVPFSVLGLRNDATVASRFIVDYLNSGRDLVQQRPPAASGEVVIIANPDFNAHDGGEPSAAATPGAERRDFPPLEGTKIEAERIARMLDGVRSLSDGDATVQALQAIARPAVLHIATHGVFLPMDRPATRFEAGLLPIGAELYVLLEPSASALDNPLLFTGLALAGANNSSGGKNSGIITALEISGLQLQGTQLVVLSACDTALGSSRQGEEFSGLRRAIAIAGAASQVTSLWKVDDTATAELFTNYYTLLLQGKGRAEALQLAQNILRAKHPAWRHPFYWAAFIASGDWSSVHLTPRAGASVTDNPRPAQ